MVPEGPSGSWRGSIPARSAKANASAASGFGLGVGPEASGQRQRSQTSGALWCKNLAVRFLLLALVACADLRRPPTFPEQAAGRPVIAEQALLGLSADGDAAVALLIDAEGAKPRLSLSVFDAGGGAGRALLAAPDAAARKVAQRVRDAGHRASPVLAAALAADWPEASAAAGELGGAGQLGAAVAATA